MLNRAIIIGGSAGSFSVVTKILSALPKSYPVPVILCLHRLKHVRSGFAEALSIKSNLPIVEPNDKDKIESGKVYLAPANYHLYIELTRQFALSTEEPVNHSRPSIDLSFVSAAFTYKDKLTGIILSGANNDGAYGLKKVKDLGGIAIIQDPTECQVNTMPVASMKLTNADLSLSSQQIIEYLLKH